ncbi:DUF6084 family protein [Streptomyces sp. LP05-1]|uniref:DUF6084 family protein n=1 Tax=Streptomyces pyxinae TaxID=2970734 RepID=A0ABT2CQ02_9ACTN|nr:DUF6084 family protein [Streptomyces sp. LP05-1]MCS0639508.1 DUF6084 family protein [Streptomyces sp. LP05-1]
MTDLHFACTGARPEPYGAGPTLLFGLRVEEADHQPVHAVVLRCQIRIEPHQRRYAPEEQERLGDLFGTPERWGTTLKPVQFAHAATVVPGFDGVTEIDLPVPCTYDTEVASASYFRALSGGEIPLLLLFSGTVFSGPRGFHAEPIPWHTETGYRMPVAVWQRMMADCFPNSAWLRLRSDCLEELRRFRSARALPSWEDTFATLLREVGDSRGAGEGWLS